MLGSYRPKYPFTAWLFRIARNVAIDEMRRRRLSTVLLDQSVETDEGTVGREFAGADPGPEAK